MHLENIKWIMGVPGLTSPDILVIMNFTKEHLPEAAY